LFHTQIKAKEKQNQVETKQFLPIAPRGEMSQFIVIDILFGKKGANF
jgi:hypothetical protein